MEEIILNCEGGYSIPSLNDVAIKSAQQIADNANQIKSGLSSSEKQFTGWVAPTLKGFKFNMKWRF